MAAGGTDRPAGVLGRGRLRIGGKERSKGELIWGIPGGEGPRGRAESEAAAAAAFCSVAGALRRPISDEVRRGRCGLARGSS